MAFFLFFGQKNDIFEKKTKIYEKIFFLLLFFIKISFKILQLAKNRVLFIE